MNDIKVEPIENYGLSKKDKPKSLFSKVGIAGFGNSGQKIALLLSSYGIDVVALDLSGEQLEKGLKEMAIEMDHRINHWGMTESEKKAILSRIKVTLSYQDFSDCDMVIECITSRNKQEGFEKKKEVFKTLEKYISSHALLVANSATMGITEFASELVHKERCVNLHISTTVPDAHIVEFVKTCYTTEEVIDNVKKFCKLINKFIVPVEESPGLITVRIFVSLIAEACETLMEGIASVEEIDYSMRHSLGLPLGPFEIADKIGLDTVNRWMENLQEEFGDPRYKPSPILKRMVRANNLGRKTRQGFYKYNPDGQKADKQIFRLLNH
ncbi:MAG: 3-hydroxyacyl-CoA dehydrogenase family protein [Bacteroidia bacterium]|nr:3-hydroxyacyl-CoA dehydrogenase family protein [Bacteroidia bacterium]